MTADTGLVIQIIGDREQAGVVIGTGIDGDEVIDPCVCIAARMVAPGVAQVTRADGDTIRVPAWGDDVGQMIGEAWDVIAEYIGIETLSVVTPDGAPSDLGPTGASLARAWDEHRRLWLAENAV